MWRSESNLLGPHPSLRQRWPSALGWCGALLLILASCGHPQRVSSTLDDFSLNRFCRAQRAVQLQETKNVVNVTPVFDASDPGRLIVADSREAQVRLYNRDGKLVSYVGRHGEGPSEFRYLAGATHIPGRPDSALAVEPFGRLHWIDWRRGAVVKTQQLPMLYVYSAIQLTDSTVFVAGLRAQGVDGTQQDLLHVWDTRSSSIVRNFLPMPTLNRDLHYPRSFVWATFDMLSGSIAAVVNVSDTLYVFNDDGKAERAIPLHLAHFRPVHSPPPHTRGHTLALERWLSSFSQFISVEFLNRSTVLVQYTDRISGVQHARLAELKLSGGSERTVFEESLRDLRLVGRSADRRMLFFLDSDPYPNRLVACSP